MQRIHLENVTAIIYTAVDYVTNSMYCVTKSSGVGCGEYGEETAWRVSAWRGP